MEINEHKKRRTCCCIKPFNGVQLSPGLFIYSLHTNKKKMNIIFVGYNLGGFVQF